MCIAIECGYKLDQKNEFKFLCELCTFLQIRSQLLVIGIIKCNLKHTCNVMHYTQAILATLPTCALAFVCNFDAPSVAPSLIFF